MRLHHSINIIRLRAYLLLHEAHSLQHSNQPPDKVKVECDTQHFDSKIAPTLSKKGSSSSSINDQQKMSSTDKQSMMVHLARQRLRVEKNQKG